MVNPADSYITVITARLGPQAPVHAGPRPTSPPETNLGFVGQGWSQCSAMSYHNIILVFDHIREGSDFQISGYLKLLQPKNQSPPAVQTTERVTGNAQMRGEVVLKLLLNLSPWVSPQRTLLQHLVPCKTHILFKPTNAIFALGSC